MVVNAIRKFEEAETASDFVARVQKEEKESNHVRISAKDLAWGPDRRVSIVGGAHAGDYELAGEAEQDVAKHTDVPSKFLGNCEEDLWEHIVRTRWDRKVPPGLPLDLLVVGQKVERIQPHRSLRMVARSPLLEAILNKAPAGISMATVRVLPDHWNGSIDVSLISSGLTDAPVAGDTIYGGVNVRETTTGSVQVSATTFRLVCSNGAVVRLCSENQHHLRRLPDRPENDQRFLKTVGEFAHRAWAEWEGTRRALKDLTTRSVPVQDLDNFGQQLRRAPYLLDARVIDQILDRIRNDHRDRTEVTLYDFWNYLTAMGTHDRDLRELVRRRLRVASGSLLHQRGRLCESCRQLVVVPS